METKFWEQGNKGNLKGVRPAKEETRTDLFEMFFCDTSGSMGCATRVVGETGEEKSIPKIDQLNEGFKMAHKSMLRFMDENTRFFIKYQLIELNTYCKAMFNTYKNVDDDGYNLSEIKFTADGVTNIEALFNTAIQFINKKHLGNYNRTLNIVMMSDGIPTDVNGFALSKERSRKIVDKFKGYLDEHDLSRNVAFYFIAIGDEAEEFGRYFAGDDHFYKVEDCESISEKFDFVTRQTLADSTTSSMPCINFGEDENEDFSDTHNDEPVIDPDTENLLKTVCEEDQTSVDDTATLTTDGCDTSTAVSEEDEDDGLDFYGLCDDGDDDYDDGEGGDSPDHVIDEKEESQNNASKHKSEKDELSDLLTF